ncbi:MAG: tRNA (N(6)-L-threonylcarbamoyladenosine(37)-C(2))-methylthiotransferase MtaB [Defluviitaleaceae bacterium]|nr:tRNA (N(6)-L-threonylcarbamoyladenosine(37)-C(2))-methylthiotransferase MtaB [Defluviitaleaceae bacterium]MCL2239192.1 tRNA (N(6)-L-threonylcarbamoyladenosine(37)-C(2))-methylthiotransferase MtaB [Defluviitaleaceae bacterium]
MAATFAVRTLGCKVNQCDADALCARLGEAGYVPVAFGPSHTADIYIVNTCTVTKTVDRKSLQMIRRARRMNPKAFVAVCGCGARLSGEMQTLGEVDFVFDARKPEDLLGALGAWNALPSGTASPQPGKTRAFLKVQDGCDRFCAYCIVPYARGGVVSTPTEEILGKAAALVRGGTKEIVLTGIQLAAYGKDTQETLPGLIRRVAGIPSLGRLRLSSLDPWAVNADFLQAVGETQALCDHFHLSLQSGCDATLMRMNRRYTTLDYARAVEGLRAIRPNAAITTDIIVGFPGETDADHAQSLAFARETRFARIHVFPYSLREGTAAAKMPHPVPAPLKKARNAQMLALAAQSKAQFLAAQVGRPAEILYETPHQGHTRNYCLVRTPQAAPVNTLATVHITGQDNHMLKGEKCHD